VDNWKQSFLKKLDQAQKQCARRFEKAMDEHVVPVFEDLAEFVGSNGFTVSTPMRETGRRSFKFELAENVYVLFIFRFFGVAELELRREIFVPGCEPLLTKSVARVMDINKDWARKRFQTGLDDLLDRLVTQAESTRKEPQDSPSSDTATDEEEELVIA